MSKRDTRLLLEDINDAAQKILDYTEGMDKDGFISDNKTIDAVVRNFEIIGEAATKIPDDFKLKHPEIEWHRMSGLRNRIIHEYFGIDYEIVWQIVQNNIAELIERITFLLTGDS